MTGRRLSDEVEKDASLAVAKPGDYWLALWRKPAVWHVMSPNGLLGALSNHAVTVLPDGSITVSPSIQITRSAGEGWHGFLVAGVWSAC